MVQLNPFKWGQKKRQEKLKISKLKETISGSGGGRYGAKKRTDAKKTLNQMGHLTDKQKADKDKQTRKAYDKEHKIVNRRGRVTGYKEGYDPSKGVQKKTSSKTTASQSTSKSKEIARLKSQIRLAGGSDRGKAKRRLQDQLARLQGR
tara:strand:+ start:431 stop:874 length:444 start_codon:yes stop_codon:yes gene_type:complete